MKIGIIGSGEIGGSLARRLSKLGHKVFIANSRGPESLADLTAETGATAVTANEAARSGEVVFVAIPVWKIVELPKNLFDGVSPDVAVVDTGNYYPRERDGRIDAIEEGVAESRWVANLLGRPVLKAINNLHWRSLLDGGKPAGTPGRIALPVSGDNETHKAMVIGLFDQLGFDGADAGQLDESWRQQPGTPVYAANLDAEGVRKALAEASPERRPEFRAVPNSSIGKP
ncbi:NAD(P)-binding domain-containing protein [Bradyrhizobium huanghuaihaiense]|uniref:NADPH-dependent F420 reductase n=1 Tax=Bradyrhizobium huanghuaihaiense TaxID=990078 RepID=UPI0021AA2CF3|nr:NAD(P)-binding domain-containing protein [Bradyrhizobium sp. CB3035]UWU76189.1 NAD(P)-binding domain-containing protein [Bradyrhizobium sp. CB3035]